MIVKLIQDNLKEFTYFHNNPPKAIVPEVGQEVYVVDTTNWIGSSIILKATRQPDKHLLQGMHLTYENAGRSVNLYITNANQSGYRCFADLYDAREYQAAKELYKRIVQLL